MAYFSFFCVSEVVKAIYNKQIDIKQHFSKTVNNVLRYDKSIEEQNTKHEKNGKVQSISDHTL